MDRGTTHRGSLAIHNIAGRNNTALRPHSDVPKAAHLTPGETSLLSIGISPLLACVIIAVVGIVFYSSSFSGVMLYDDLPNIVDNQSIRSLDAAWSA